MIGHVARECGERLNSRSNANKVAYEKGDAANIGMGDRAAGLSEGLEGFGSTAGKEVREEERQQVRGPISGVVAGEKGVGRKEAVSDCREDRGYGDWTLVQRRKPRMNSQNQGASSGFYGGGAVGRQNLAPNGRGKPDGGIMIFKAMGNVEGGKEGGIAKVVVNKPMLVHKRGGELNSPNSLGGELKAKGGGMVEGEWKRSAVGGGMLRLLLVAWVWC